jgi:serine protease AprX
MKTFNFNSRINVKIIFFLLLFSACKWLQGQESSFSYYYRISLRDKGDNTIGKFTPEDLLSQRAIIRRQKTGIKLTDFRDLPVYKRYIDQITALGFTLHCTSKWMNTALFKTQLPVNISILNNLPFINEVKIVKSPGKKSNFNDKLDFLVEQADLPLFDRPVTMVNGYSLHNSGFNGKGILIAVLDGGFTNADQVSSLNNLRIRKGIKATYDFVRKNKFVYNYSTHGTAVLSVLSGKIDGTIEGTAQGADYLLLRTEDVESEFPCEEDFWAAGAEFADSSGADIISSSLGYYNFDDTDLNYKYSDLDGNTAFVTRAADIAASKGILVVNSAGNERNSFWKRIIFPADGDSVLAVGAVDGNNLISTFSSAGPSADGRIKPDNATMGVSVPVQTSVTSIGRSNGTSFSCPILSGMAACLMQAVPLALNTDIIKALQTGADRYNSPDSLYGYGIPDMEKSLSIIQDIFIIVPGEANIVFPNPTTGNFDIIFRQPPEYLTIEIISIAGKMLFRKAYPEYAGRTIRISELQDKEQGIYFLRLITGQGVDVQKIIKLDYHD